MRKKKASHGDAKIQKIFSNTHSCRCRLIIREEERRIDEVQIPKQLYPLVVTICREIAERDDRDVQPPNPECQNWSPEIDGADEPSTDKRPDFTCNCTNRYAVSNAEYVIPLHIECKLLGKPTSPSWKLNRNYVTHGIARFDLKSHEYGVRAPSAIMIGYVISMAPDTIQAEVNAALSSTLPTIPQPNFEFDNVPMQTRHQFARKNVMPVEFVIVHLWIDIRDSYQQS